MDPVGLEAQTPGNADAGPLLRFSSIPSSKLQPRLLLSHWQSFSLGLAGVVYTTGCKPLLGRVSAHIAPVFLCLTSYAFAVSFEEQTFLIGMKHGSFISLRLVFLASRLRSLCLASGCKNVCPSRNCFMCMFAVRLAWVAGHSMGAQLGVVLTDTHGGRPTLLPRLRRHLWENQYVVTRASRCPAPDPMLYPTVLITVPLR